jgi:hypothetical protein
MKCVPLIRRVVSFKQTNVSEVRIVIIRVRQYTPLKRRSDYTALYLKRLCILRRENMISYKVMNLRVP